MRYLCKLNAYLTYSISDWCAPVGMQNNEYQYTASHVSVALPKELDALEMNKHELMNGSGQQYLSRVIELTRTALEQE